MEGDAGAARRLKSADQVGIEVTAVDSVESEVGADQVGIEVTAEDSERRSSRLGRRWTIGVCAVLVALAAGVATGGYFGLRYHRESQAIARDNAAALAAAKDCVAATQAPDPAAMAGAEQKIIECSTGDFRTQAALYSGIFVQGYRAANVHVQMSDMRAAVERNNDDGSVDVLVAFRIKVDNVETQGREYGYRLRVQMVREDERYRIAKLDQVAK